MKRIRLLSYVLLSIFIGLNLLVSSCEESPAYQPLQLNVLNSMQRVLPNIAIRGKESVEIMAARNEYEAFQVIISAGQQNHLQDIRINISSLQSDESTIDHQNITAYRAEEVFVQHSSPFAELPPGLYPDPLLPFINPVTGDSILTGKKLKAPLGEPLRTPLYSA